MEGVRHASRRDRAPDSAREAPDGVPVVTGWEPPRRGFRSTGFHPGIEESPSSPSSVNAIRGPGGGTAAPDPRMLRSFAVVPDPPPSAAPAIPFRAVGTAARIGG